MIVISLILLGCIAMLIAFSFTLQKDVKLIVVKIVLFGIAVIIALCFVITTILLQNNYTNNKLLMQYNVSVDIPHYNAYKALHAKD